MCVPVYCGEYSLISWVTNMADTILLLEDKHQQQYGSTSQEHCSNFMNQSTCETSHSYKQVRPILGGATVVYIQYSQLVIYELH